ncbi:LysM peptidoglycan-binding domain-containing protein [Phycicoccus sp. CSK15P-2]|uniref:LysM peptidoglycan-binding domain-containing protein n=1 Tax=Phycicoccus sp. CSK15P-2 TaxID=2807627 RepID=UPI0019524220|nr:LysM peptidoglycan-binding domain-containing protein [Phycicoccus sp. CSK15P-2]MBM6404029.1 LysM peptidoglycan-binding domain-containing protein [Phycicoccus sp. CSK15P-2]
MVVAAPPPATPVLESVTALVERSRTAPHGWTTYTVRSGDTLVGIAARHRTTIGTLTSRNHLANPGLIHPGQRLSVPRTSAPAKKAARTATPAVERTVHTVRAGETVSHIAARYGVSVASVLKANGLRASSLIHPGDRLTVRATRTTTKTTASRTAKRASKATSASAARTYTVRSGDTLSHIAARYGTTPAKIASASGISTRSLLHPGQRLRIPTGSPKSSTKTTSTSSGASVPSTFNGVGYPEDVVAAARRNHARLAARSVPSRDQVKAMVARTARRHGVDPKLALAISYQESGWNQRAVSPANAVGVMQVIPAGGEWASSLVGRRLDLLDTQDNITAGVVMLRALGRATSNTETAVAAYYQGLASVRQRGMYADTRRYVANVMSLRKRM